LSSEKVSVESLETKGCLDQRLVTIVSSGADGPGRWRQHVIQIAGNITAFNMVQYQKMISVNESLKSIIIYLV
jgi:hypothetical protein